MTFRLGTDHLIEIEGYHIKEILVVIIDTFIEGDHDTILEMTMEEIIIQDKGVCKLMVYI